MSADLPMWLQHYEHCIITALPQLAFNLLTDFFGILTYILELCSETK